MRAAALAICGVRNECRDGRPQSQSFSQSYGSNLPTSLDCVILSTRGCSPWRPDAVIGTARATDHPRPQIFTGHRRRTGHLHEQVLSRPSAPPLWIIHFRGPQGASTRTENSCQGLRGRLWACLALPQTIVAHGPGILTRLPFGLPPFKRAALQRLPVP